MSRKPGVFSRLEKTTHPAYEVKKGASYWRNCAIGRGYSRVMARLEKALTQTSVSPEGRKNVGILQGSNPDIAIHTYTATMGLHPLHL